MSFRILDFNYPFDSATNFLPTSEDPSFPAENLAHFFRSKVWRSYGFFRITSSNNRLDFNDGGSEIQVTIPTGEYTVAELEAVIAARMVIAGGSAVYTVTFSRSTAKWTIASSGGTFQLLSSTGTNVANGIWATLGFETAANHTGATTYTAAAVAIHTEERLVIDLGNRQDIDSFAILFDPELGHKFTTSASIKLQASNSNYWYGSPAVDVTLTPDDTYDVITHFFSSAQNYRYWCIRIVDAANPYGYVEIPKVVLAKATTLGQDPQVGFVERLLDQSDITENSYGHSFSDLYPTRRTLRFNYEVLSKDDLETLRTIERRLGGVVPLAVALDPLATTFDKDRFFLYGRLQRGIDAANLAYTYFNTEFVVEEAF